MYERKNTQALEGWLLLALVSVLAILVAGAVGIQVWTHFVGPIHEVLR